MEKTKTSPTRSLRPRLAPSVSATSSPPVRSGNSPSYSSPKPPGLSPVLSPGLGRPYVRLAQDPSTPANNALNNANVTPRSSARTSRPGSSQSTPTSPEKRRFASPASATSSSATPGRKTSPTRSGVSDRSEKVGAGRRDAPVPGKLYGFPVSTATQQSPTFSKVIQGTQESDTTSSTFFYADEAPAQPQPQKPIKQANKFFYADGSRESYAWRPVPAESQTAQHNPVSPSSLNNTQSLSSRSGNENGNVTKLASPSETSLKSAPAALQGFAPVIFRAASPPKTNFHLSYRKGASQIIRPQASPPQPQDSSFIESPETSRRSSIQSQRRLSSLDTVPESRKVSLASKTSSFVTDLIPLADSDQNSTRTVKPTHLSTGSFSTFLDHNASESRSPESDSVQSPPLAPTDPAARARYERKVLDLEISNSSLLAINRSLEREVRRQKTELRRLRRLSRNSGVNRASWLSDATSLSDVSHLEALGEADEEGFEEDYERTLEAGELEEEEEGDEEGLGTAELAERDARHHREDQRRLTLDLARHKQLLIDSQKLNVSLRRCLGITEQLIKDGTKAIDYQVRVSDVEIGGRVLSPEELEEKEAEDRVHGAPSYFTHFSAVDGVNDNGEEAADVDSGLGIDYGPSKGDAAESMPVLEAQSREIGVM